MTTLVVGASGATGRLLVEQLLERGERVKIIVRSPSALPETIRNNEILSVTQASILDLTEAEMAEHADGCEAIASCLGHNLSFRGMFLPPRWLVTHATQRLCDAVKANKPDKPVKFVLMNTAANSNRDLDESISFSQRIVIGILRLFLPPHVDNEGAADYLRTEIGQSDREIEWAAVRPDGLVNEDKVSEIEQHPSPTRSTIFDAGKTSRINVAAFMADLITDDGLWQKWKGKMPVIYNKESA